MKILHSQPLFEIGNEPVVRISYCKLFDAIGKNFSFRLMICLFEHQTVFYKWAPDYIYSNTVPIVSRICRQGKGPLCGRIAIVAKSLDIIAFEKDPTEKQ